MVANITFLSVLLFSMCNSIRVAVNTWLNCSFFTLIKINIKLLFSRILKSEFKEKYIVNVTTNDLLDLGLVLKIIVTGISFFCSNCLSRLNLNVCTRQLTDPEDVSDTDSCVVDLSPGGREVISERVLGITAAGVDGHVLVMN